MSTNDKRKLNKGGSPARARFPTFRELALFVEAAFAVILASLAIKLPFRWLAAFIAKGTRADVAGKLVASDIVQAVDRASRRLPWKTVCFQQGLAVHWLLRRRRIPSILHYGIKTGGNDISSHVWVTLGGEVLIGGEEAAQHALVASFPRQ